jgi:hypothetical protein
MISIGFLCSIKEMAWYQQSVGVPGDKPGVLSAKMHPRRSQTTNVAQPALRGLPTGAAPALGLPPAKQSKHPQVFARQPKHPQVFAGGVHICLC